MAEFKLSRFKYTWHGEWTPGARYNPDYVVSYGGKVYVSLETHNSNTNFYADLDYYNNDSPPLLVPKWELISMASVGWEIGPTAHTINEVTQSNTVEWYISA
jgi:hypothetical protein